jgi:hypothetical protein
MRASQIFGHLFFRLLDRGSNESNENCLTVSDIINLSGKFRC